MATREARLAEFSQGTPKENRPLQILCEDKCGTYLIPYPCQWSDGAWRKVGSAKIIEATVMGWRTAPRSWRYDEPHVRYWHKADMPSCAAHVRFRG
jgi:hypothetical protein